MQISLAILLEIVAGKFDFEAEGILGHIVEGRRKVHAVIQQSPPVSALVHQFQSFMAEVEQSRKTVPQQVFLLFFQRRLSLYVSR